MADLIHRDTKGVFVIAATPFADDGALDLNSTDRLVDFYLDLDLPENQVVLDYAVIYLAIAALFQLFDSGQVIASCSLRGLRDTRKPMLLAAFGYWGIGVPTALLLGFEAGWGGKGVWLGLAVGLAVTAVMLIGRFALRERFHLVQRR